MSTQFPSPPGGVGIRLIEATTDRIVISIPRGGRSGRGLGVFALFWNIIVIPLSVVFLSVPDEGWDGGPPPRTFLILFLSVFWLVGIVFAIIWLKLRFTTTLIALTPGELSLQRLWLGTKKMTRTQLDERSRATLEVSYQSNDTNVYRVSVTGVDREEHFGTRLSQGEKDWLVSAINRFIDPDSTACDPEPGRLSEYCTDCGTELLIGNDKRVCPDCGRVFLDEEVLEADEAAPVALAAESVESIAPHEIAPGSPIVIAIDEPDQLQFWYPFRHSILTVVACFLGLFSLFWYTVVISVVGIAVFNAINGKGNAGEVLIFGGVGLVFGLIGLFPLRGAVGVFRARVVISVNRQQLEGRFQAGLIKMKRSISTASIRDVGLGHQTLMRRGEQPGGRTESRTLGHVVGMVYSSEFDMPVTMGTDRQLDQDVTGLIRYQLARMGHRIADE